METSYQIEVINFFGIYVACRISTTMRNSSSLGSANKSIQVFVFQVRVSIDQLVRLRILSDASSVI